MTAPTMTTTAKEERKRNASDFCVLRKEEEEEEEGEEEEHDSHETGGKGERSLECGKKGRKWRFVLHAPIFSTRSDASGGGHATDGRCARSA